MKIFQKIVDRMKRPATIDTETTGGNAMNPEEFIEAARVQHPEVVVELERLRLWCVTCIGVDVASWGGPAVD